MGVDGVKRKLSGTRLVNLSVQSLRFGVRLDFRLTISPLPSTNKLRMLDQNAKCFALLFPVPCTISIIITLQPQPAHMKTWPPQGILSAESSMKQDNVVLDTYLADEIYIYIENSRQ